MIQATLKYFITEGTQNNHDGPSKFQQRLLQGAHSTSTTSQSSYARKNKSTRNRQGQRRSTIHQAATGKNIFWMETYKRKKRKGA